MWVTLCRSFFFAADLFAHRAGFIACELGLLVGVDAIRYLRIRPASVFFQGFSANAEHFCRVHCGPAQTVGAASRDAVDASQSLGCVKPLNDSAPANGLRVPMALHRVW